MRPFVAMLRRLAVFLRQVAAFGAFIISLRLLWLSCVSGLAYARTPVSADPLGAASDTAELSSVPSGAFNPHRPDLEELENLAGASKMAPPPAPPPAVPKLRRILVDVGPPRSEVFIRKTKVGHTPYGGQVACVAAEELRVLILPPEGVPLVRVVPCHGDTLLVQQ